MHMKFTLNTLASVAVRLKYSVAECLVNNEYALHLRAYKLAMYFTTQLLISAGQCAMKNFALIHISVLLE